MDFHFLFLIGSANIWKFFFGRKEIEGKYLEGIMDIGEAT